MPWVHGNLKAALPGDFKSLVTGAQHLNSGLQAISTILKAAIIFAKAFSAATMDPAATLVKAIIAEIEQVGDDFFGTGFYMLVVTPIKTYDRFGIPTMTPAQALQAAIASFDDAGDSRRPQFSDLASVAGFGIMVTVASPTELIDKLGGLISVFNLDGLKVYLKQAKRAAERPPPPSVPPNWVSIRLADLPGMGALQKIIKGYLEQFRGYITTGDQYLNDLIDVIAFKANKISKAIDDLNKAIDNIVNAIGATGVYWLDIPTGVGGNKRLKSAIPDNFFTGLAANKYTVLILFVAGGPDVTGMEKLKQLTSITHRESHL